MMLDKWLRPWILKEGNLEKTKCLALYKVFDNCGDGKIETQMTKKETFSDGYFESSL